MAYILKQNMIFVFEQLVCPLPCSQCVHAFLDAMIIFNWCDYRMSKSRRRHLLSTNLTRCSRGCHLSIMYNTNLILRKCDLWKYTLDLWPLPFRCTAKFHSRCAIAARFSFATPIDTRLIEVLNSLLTTTSSGRQFKALPSSSSRQPVPLPVNSIVSLHPQSINEMMMSIHSHDGIFFLAVIKEVSVASLGGYGAIWERIFRLGPAQILHVESANVNVDWCPHQKELESSVTACMLQE